jgi:hypothetical protein
MTDKQEQVFSKKIMVIAVYHINGFRGYPEGRNVEGRFLY